MATSRNRDPNQVSLCDTAELDKEAAFYGKDGDWLASYRQVAGQIFAQNCLRVTQGFKPNCIMRGRRNVSLGLGSEASVRERRALTLLCCFPVAGRRQQWCPGVGSSTRQPGLPLEGIDPP